MEMRASWASQVSIAVSSYRLAKSSTFFRIKRKKFIFFPSSMATESKLVTVLSIDGGGVRGLIPTTVLDFLESYLKEQENDNNVRIADYFDFIAGTSTGGLVTAMLASPDPSESNRAFSTDKIKKFYYEESPKIFPQKSQHLKSSALPDKTRSMLEAKELVELMEKNEESVVGLTMERSLSMPGWITWIINKVKSIFETIYFPKYHGDRLEKAIKEKVGDRKLCETLTNVIIPSFDIKLLQPTVFSTLKATHDDLEDARLLDVCLSTSAAPYFLPLHKFEISTLTSSRKFNMVDGGVAANNPTLLALSEVAKEMSADGKSPCLSNMDCSKILVLSLGTGSSKRNNQLQGFQETGGGPLDWVLGDNGIPIINVLLTASDDMVDIYLSAFFQGSGFEKNYLRIQTDSMKDSEITMDNSNKDNLENLEKIGKDLLQKPVSAVNLATGLLEPIKGGGSNEEALKKFGDRLLAERKRRQGKSSN